MNNRIAGKLQSISSKPGPKTEEGRNKVRWNSYVHGLTAQNLIIHESDQPHYDKMAEGFRLRFQPADGFEYELLQKVIDTNWRLTICTSVESAMLSKVTMRQWDKPDDTTRNTYMSRRARTFTESANAFGILGRYESGLQRRFHTMLRELEAAIANRPEPLDSIPIALPAPVPAEPLVPAAEAPPQAFAMAAAASSQSKQNEPLTAKIDSFRQDVPRTRSICPRKTGRSSN